MSNAITLFNRKLFRISLVMTVFLFLGNSKLLAMPIGDDYFISGQNFPNNFISAPATFNATGDLSVEPAGGVLVTEQYFDNGNDLTIFQFQFTALPVNSFDPFGFLIADLDFSDGLQRELASAFLSIDFGVSQLGLTDITPLTTSFDLNGLWIGFTSPVSWDGIFQSTNANSPPTQIVTQLRLEFNRVPEPSVFGLILLGSIMLLLNRISFRFRKVNT